MCTLLCRLQLTTMDMLYMQHMVGRALLSKKLCIANMGSPVPYTFTNVQLSRSLLLNDNIKLKDELFGNYLQATHR